MSLERISEEELTVWALDGAVGIDRQRALIAEVRRLREERDVARQWAELWRDKFETLTSDGTWGPPPIFPWEPTPDV